MNYFSWSEKRCRPLGDVKLGHYYRTADLEVCSAAHGVAWQTTNKWLLILGRHACECSVKKHWHFHILKHKKTNIWEKVCGEKVRLYQKREWLSSHLSVQVIMSWQQLERLTGSHFAHFQSYHAGYLHQHPATKNKLEGSRDTTISIPDQGQIFIPLPHVYDPRGPSGLQTCSKMMCGEMESN